MASFVADTTTSCWAPNPQPERGASFSVDSNGSGTKICYGSGYSVVIREVGNPHISTVYTEHKKAPKVARFHPTQDLIASGDDAGVIRVWDINSLQTKKELPFLGGGIADIGFDETGKRLAACGDAKGANARVIMWESGSPQGEISCGPKRGLSVSIRPSNPSRLATGGEDMKVRLHNGPPYKFDQSFDAHKNFVQCVRYSPCGTYLATCSNDKAIYLLDGETGEQKAALPEDHKGSVYAVSWSDDGKQLLSCSGDKTVKLWDVGTGKCISSITLGKAIEDMQVGCTMAGQLGVSLSLSGDLNFIDLKAGKVSNIVQAHTGTPTALVRDWASDGQEVYCGSADGDVYGYTFDGTGYRFEGKKPGTNDGLSVNKGVLFSVGHDDLLRSAKVGKGAYAFDSATCPTGSTPTGVSSGISDPELAVVCTEETVMLCRGGRVVDRQQVKFGATCCAISKDCKEVAVGGSDKKVHFFNVSGDKLQASGDELSGMQQAVSVIAYSPTDMDIAVGDKHKEITLWNRDTKECKIRNKWVFHQSGVTALAFSPDGKYLASGASDTRLIIWNTEKALKKTIIYPAHALGVFSVAWLDDKTVVSGGGDGCVRKWTPALP